MPTFTEAPDVAMIVHDLVDLHHPLLKKARIRALASEKGKKKDGYNLVAWAKKVDPLAHYLSGTPSDERENENDEDDGVDFVIICDADMWEWQKEDVKRRAIDRLLMGMRGSPGDWDLVENDFEGYFEDIRRYGATGVMKRVADALQQQELPLMGGVR